MFPNYLPIFKVKAGEIKAVANSSKAHLRHALPLFEVCRIGRSVRNASRFRDSSALTCAYLDEIAQQIASVRRGDSALVDAFQWRPDSMTETGEHVISYIHSRLEAQGVKVVPVIGYDRWDSPIYRLALQGIDLGDAGYYCLRLDSHAIEDAEEPEFFKSRVIEILNDLNIEAQQCAVLIDFGDVTALPIEDLIERAARVLGVIGPMEFKFYATAGCSLPPSIDRVVEEKDSTGKVIRKEMVLWQAMRIEYAALPWLFGDYGVRGPMSAEDVIAPHTNGKIRYTIDHSYFVVRGHSLQQGDKGAQMHKLAKVVVGSAHYMGTGFSWGDEQILACSTGKFKGNSCNWIAIDTNHHLAYVVSELAEFERTLASTRATI